MSPIVSRAGRGIPSERAGTDTTVTRSTRAGGLESTFVMPEISRVVVSAALEMATPSTLPARVASARAGVDRGITGTTLGLGWFALNVLACFVGGAKLVTLAFPAGAVLMALGLLFLRRWNSYLVFTIIMWFHLQRTSPVRGLEDHLHAQSPVILTAALVSLVALPWALLACVACARRR